MRYAGELNPGTYWPRKVENLPVDVHSVMSLVAPRIVLTNGGTDTPQGFGDAWTDPRGMYLAGAVSSAVWNHLGWPGQIIPQGTVFTSGPGESVGGTPPVDVAFIDGTIGWRRHHEGHTPAPDWPSFLQLVSRHFTNNRPVVTPAQRFTLGDGPVNVVGTVQATGADNDALANWQITGGRRVGAFVIDRGTGELTIANARSLDLADTASYRLTVIVDDGKLASKEEVVTIDVPDKINVCHRGRTISVPKRAVRAHLRHGDAIGRCT
jgi:hypothetical protein